MPDMPRGQSVSRRVDMMLAAAGVHLSAEDRRCLLKTYTTLLPRIEALYDVPGADDEVPALVFLADPSLSQWPADVRSED